MKRLLLKIALIVIAAALLTAVLVACDPVDPPYVDRYPIEDGPDNDPFLDHTTKDQAIDKAVDSMENLLNHLDTEEASETGYYVGANMTINTEGGARGDSAFRLNLQANLYTYPYEIKDADGNVILDPDTGLPLVDEEALAIHNDRIRYSDMILEWYDGATNEMLIGFYFDGINRNAVDDGNDLYLNLQGSKRIFRDFGNSVLFQQIVRLITSFNLETLIGSATEGGTADSSFQTLRDALDMAIDNNYQQTINGNESTIFFDSVNLTQLSSDINDYINSIFSPFEDKLDPLSNKYLGFLISTLGNTSITTINSDMQFVMEPNENLDNRDIMTALIIDASGGSNVQSNSATGSTISIPYDLHAEARYSIRTSSDITFDKVGYTEYSYGDYEYTGDMFIPMLGLQLDVLLRTDMNEYDNKINEVYMACRDLATDDLMLGLYYKDELIYVDVEGIQDLYGGVQIEDLGLPKAYRDGFDLADTLSKLFDLIDEYIVIAVDNILYGNNTAEGEESQFEQITGVIVDNMESTMKDESDPSSRATMQIRIDFEMIRKILSMTSETGTEYTVEQLILILNNQFNIDIQSIASIAGVSIEELIEKSYFYLTYDVDYYSIKLEVYSTAEMSDEEIAESGPLQVLRMDLYPQHIGEEVRIVFPSFEGFKEFQDVMTYSGYLEGQFLFAATEEVDLSMLLGSFMGDESGLNTPFILPEAADIYFTLYYDQYIREQFLDNGRWTRRARSAFSLYLYMVVEDTVTPLAHVYANDVSLNTADPVEELGYVWLQYDCLDGYIGEDGRDYTLPRFKVREDHFVRGFYAYMGYDFDSEDDDVVLGLTDIVGALMEDSWATFEPDVIRVTTSNQTIKDFFRVDELIGTVSAQIGFKQRVFNIDELESGFAMYTVGDLEDLKGNSVYSVKLHETIPVIFDFGTSITVKDMFFLYDEDSIAVVNEQQFYMPTTKNLFMGVSRDYNVEILTEAGRLAIDNLRLIGDNGQNLYEWEPLEPVPDTAEAYYGGTGISGTYPAVFDLHATFDRDSGYYYTVHSENGYQTVYDLQNNLYIIGLGENLGYDRVWDELNPEIQYLYKEYRNAGMVDLRYDFGTRLPGWYLVVPEAGMVGGDIVDSINKTSAVLYNAVSDYYVVEDRIYETVTGEDGLPVNVDFIEKLNAANFGIKRGTLLVPDESQSDPDAKKSVNTITYPRLYPLTIEYYGQTWYFDPVTAGYYLEFAEITESGSVILHRAQLDVRYAANEPAADNPYYEVTDEGSDTETRIYRAEMNITGNVYTDSTADAAYLSELLDADVISGRDFDSAAYAGVRWQRRTEASDAGLPFVDTVAFKGLDIGDSVFTDQIAVGDNGSDPFGPADWEDVTINGGIYVVYVIIGDGMMATYRENVRVKILNREIDTDKFVNVVTPDGIAEEVAVADSIDVDPYVYLMFKAYYSNEIGNASGDELREAFVSWYFGQYNVQFNFTKIYGEQVEEETPAEIGTFQWHFDDADSAYATYSEFDIDNRSAAGENRYTYVYTVFHGQVIALEIEVLPRTLDSFYVPGENSLNTYTVDALEPDTYTLPVDLIYFYTDGSEYYVLNPSDLTDTENAIYTELLGKKPLSIFEILNRPSDNLAANAEYTGAATSLNAATLGAFGNFAGNNAQPLISWLNPAADNVLLVGNSGDPFIGFDGNVTRSVVNYPGYFDYNRNWYPDNDFYPWFVLETVEITVEVPDKVVAQYKNNFNVTDISSGAPVNDQVPETVYNVSPGKPAENPGVPGSMGIYTIDPFAFDSYFLGGGLYVYFDVTDAEGKVIGYDERYYEVTWRGEYSLSDGSTVEVNSSEVDFTAFVRDRAGRADYVILTATIGSAGQTLDLKIGVQLQTAYMDGITFTADGAPLYTSDTVPEMPYGDGAVVESDWDGTELRSPLQQKKYTYYVDTYDRFAVPDAVVIKFNDGSERSYALNWNDHKPWEPGATVTAKSVIGDGVGAGIGADGNDYIALVYSVEGKTISEFEFALPDLWQGAVVLSGDVGAKTIAVNIAECADGSPRVRYIIPETDDEYVAVYAEDGSVIDRYVPHEFFMLLFGALPGEAAGNTGITLHFNESGRDPQEIDVFDAATSAYDRIMSTFDTQQIIEDGGQKITIYLGQGNGADNYDVVLHIPAADNEVYAQINFANPPLTGENGDAEIGWLDPVNSVVMSLNVDAYDGATNNPMFPNGFDVSEYIAANYPFTVTRGEPGSDNVVSTLYGNGGTALPTVWYYEAPGTYNGNENYADAFWAGEIDNVVPMNVDRYGYTDVIPWEVFSEGGVVWLTATLADDSRIFISITVENEPIGDLFWSAPGDTSAFKIEQGTITVSDFYAFYPLTTTLTENNLPSSLVLYSADGTDIRRNVRWTFVDDFDYNDFTYAGIGKTPIATATVKGETLTLHLEILDATVQSINRVTGGTTLQFRSETKDPETGTITINIDPYIQTAYGGAFSMPAVSGALSFGFKSYDGYENREYAYNSYAIAYDRNFSTEPIRYDYTGALLDEDLTFRIQLGTNTYSENPAPGIQEISVRVYFYNKTVIGIDAYNDMYSDVDMEAVIDPYTPDSEIGVSDTVTLYFVEGDPIDFVIGWNYLGVDRDGYSAGFSFGEADTVPYEANYDTVLRLFGGKSSGRFGYSGTVQPTGLSVQSLTYAIGIYDRYLPEYTLVDGQNPDDGEGIPNAYFLYSDPFVGRATDLAEGTLMKETEGYDSEFPLDETQGRIIWNFADENITAAGTMNGTAGTYMTVSGHVYSAERGQPVYIKVYIEPWTMTSIHRPIVGSDGNIEYQVMEGESLRFIIDTTGLSAVDHYRVGFGVRRFTINPATGALETVGTATTVRVPFVPEQLDPSAVVYEGVALSADHPYRLYFDEQAIRDSLNGTAIGNYALGNETGRELIVRTGARYQREEITVTEMNLGFGSATSGSVIFVANPLNPIFVDKPQSVVGTYNSNTPEILYGSGSEYGFDAELEWQTANINYAAYIGGGITTVTVKVRLVGAEFTYEQDMSVTLAFLDMSPNDIIRNQNIDIISSSVDKEYNEDRYSGKANPYADAYARLMTPLTTAAEGLLEGIDVIVYEVTAWGRVLIDNGGNLQVSESVRIFGVEYANCHVVRRRWNDTYDITAFTTAYTLMVKGAAKPMIIVNPIDPQFVLTPDSVTANAALQAAIGADGYYELVWFMGDNYNVFNRNGSWLGGGIDVDWNAQINAYAANGALVYSEEVQIVLATLDVLPTNRVITDGADPVPYAPKSEYAQGTYGTNNPYGDWYDTYSASTGGMTLYQMLTKAAAGLGAVEYLISVNEWNADGSADIEVYSSADGFVEAIGSYADCTAFTRQA